MIDQAAVACDDKLDVRTVARYLPFMNDASPARTDKFRRYRDKKKAQGLREVRMWVPDVNTPGFQERLNRQIAAINARSSSGEALDWIEEVIADDPEFYG